MNPLRLLVVEDDALEARLLRAHLERRGVQVRVARTVDAALAQLEQASVDAVLTDLRLPDADGVALLRHIRERNAALPVVILTAHATVEGAVEGMRAGATDFLPKPVDVDVLLAALDRWRGKPAPRVRGVVAPEAERGPGARLIGAHPRLDAVRRFAERIATVPSARVLITGESGTGKNLLARMIHDLSGARGRFVEVNCAALPAHLLEAELFGHEKGAFTDAKERKQGLIELADRGTLLLDEVGALPLDLQGKLLTFLESQEIRRVGGTRPIRVNARVIAATNEDLRDRVTERTFRLDLLYRLDVASIEMPPLRRVASTIPELALHFARDLAAGMHRPAPAISDASLMRVRTHHWPGNGRELRNTIERALIFHEGGELELELPLQRVEGHAGARGSADATLEEVEREHIAAMLREHPDADLAEIAQRLGISRKTLWEKRKRFHL